MRPVGADDRQFLERVYAESRAEELRATGWSEAQKTVFCQSQFSAQDSYYKKNYPTCKYKIIECDSKPVGRLYVDRMASEIRVVDIALLTNARGKGIGSSIMKDILSEARTAKHKVSIHVERTNPARRLYERLGFSLVEAGEVYDFLVWNQL